MWSDRLISLLLEAKENPLIRKSRRKFGLTGDPTEGGYILPSGRMLDFSGKRLGGSPGTRAQDHREISSIIDTHYEQGIDYVKHFIRSTGGIRMSYFPAGRGDSGSFLQLHFSNPPTTQQKGAIMRMRADNLTVDVDHPITGERIHNGDHTRADMGSGLSAAYRAAEQNTIKP